MSGGNLFHWATGELLIGFGNQTPKYINAGETSGPLFNPSSLGASNVFALITGSGVAFTQIYNNFASGHFGAGGVFVYGGGAFGVPDFFGNGFGPGNAGTIFTAFLDFPNANNIMCGIGGSFTNGPQLYDQNNAILSQVSFDNVKVNNTFNGSVGNVNGATLWPKGFLFVGHGADPSITFGSNNAIILLSKDGTKYWLVQLYPQSAQATGDLIAGGGGLNVTVDPTGIMYASQVNAPQNIYNSFGLNLPFFIPPPLDIHGLPGIPLPCVPFCDPTGYDFPA